MSVRLHLPEAKEGELSIEGARLHYLTRVLRLVAGDSVQLFDGRGTAFDATVVAVSEDRALLKAGPGKAAPAPRPVVIVQGLPKADKLELILQKGTELGASAFAPVAMVRSVVKLADDRAEKKTERWQKIAEEAARQCGRSDVPTVHPPSSLKDALARLPSGAALLVLDEEERAEGLLTVASGLGSAQPIALVVGPEGGLDRSEVQWLLSQGALTVTLGRRVLRTETAAFVALTVLQVLDGELGS